MPLPRRTRTHASLLATAAVVIASFVPAGAASAIDRDLTTLRGSVGRAPASVPTVTLSAQPTAAVGQVVQLAIRVRPAGAVQRVTVAGRGIANEQHSTLVRLRSDGRAVVDYRVTGTEVHHVTVTIGKGRQKRSARTSIAPLRFRPTPDPRPLGPIVALAGDAHVESLSGDGRFALVYANSDYPADPDAFPVQDSGLYRQDLTTSETTRVTPDPSTTSVSSSYSWSAISGDGAVVAYCAIDDTGTSSLVRWDAVTGERAVLRSWTRGFYCRNPYVSSDGRFITVNAQDSRGDGVLVHDSQATGDGVTLLTLSTADYGLTSISSDGRFLAFDAGFTRRPGGVANGVIVADLVARTTRVVDYGFNSAISGNGRFVVFDDLDDAYWKVRDLRTSRVVTLAKSDNGVGRSPDISQDGRFITFPATGRMYLFDQSGAGSATFRTWTQGTPDISGTTTEDGSRTSLSGSDRLWEH